MIENEKGMLTKPKMEYAEVVGNRALLAVLGGARVLALPGFDGDDPTADGCRCLHESQTLESREEKIFLKMALS